MATHMLDLFRFVLNGLANANNLLGSRAFDESKWRVIGEYVYDDEGGRHQAFLSPIEDVTVLGTRLQAHERIQIEQSLKYSRQEADMLWSMAGVVEIGHWSRGNEYGKRSGPAPFLSSPGNTGHLLQYGFHDKTRHSSRAFDDTIDTWSLSAGPRRLSCLSGTIRRSSQWFDLPAHKAFRGAATFAID